jgi:hypothetical protein
VDGLNARQVSLNSPCELSQRLIVSYTKTRTKGADWTDLSFHKRFVCYGLFLKLTMQVTIGLPLLVRKLDCFVLFKQSGYLNSPGFESFARTDWG